MAEQVAQVSSVEVVFDLGVRTRVGTLDVARKQYIELLTERLYAGQNEGWPADIYQFREMLADEKIVYAFYVENRRIVATGEAILLPANPNWQAVIGNMATLEAKGRHGYGSAVREALIEESYRRWGPRINLTLTNNEKKGNSAFYTKNGWIATNTTVYVYQGK